MKFNYLLFLAAFLICTVLTFVTLIGAGAVDEGTQGHGLMGAFLLFLSKLFYIFRFPIYPFFDEYFEGGNFFFGLLINCVFYAIIVERIVFYSRKSKFKSL